MSRALMRSASSTVASLIPMLDFIAAQPPSWRDVSPANDAALHPQLPNPAGIGQVPSQPTDRKYPHSHHIWKETQTSGLASLGHGVTSYSPSRRSVAHSPASAPNATPGVVPLLRRVGGRSRRSLPAEPLTAALRRALEVLRAIPPGTLTEHRPCRTTFSPATPTASPVAATPMKSWTPPATSSHAASVAAARSATRATRASTCSSSSPHANTKSSRSSSSTTATASSTSCRSFAAPSTAPPSTPARWSRKRSRRNAAAVILAHNHPSGVAEPSQADELITHRLRDALALVDVRVLDHFVVTGDSIVSFAERGLL